MMEPVKRILHLEDDPLDSTLVLQRLRKEGLEVTIDRVVTLAAFRNALEHNAYALILSDFTIPGLDTQEALRLAQQLRPELPFVFFSGTMGEDLGIELLKQGASDYVLKQRIGRLAPAVRRALHEADELSRRRQAEEALRQSEERFRTLADAIPQLAWTARPDGWVHWYNRRWHQYTQTTPHEMEGWGWQKLLDPHTLPKVLENWQVSLATGAPFEMIYPLRGADGSYRPFLTRAEPLKDEQGRIIQWFGTNTDVSEQKANEEALAASKLNAERAKAAVEKDSQAKDHFLAALSHELRTPLTPIVAAISLLQKQWRNDPASSETLEMIRRNVDMEARLIDDLLDVTRITRGKVELDRRPIPISQVIQNAVEVCKPDIDARQLHLAVDLGPAPPYLIDADPARLQQVFWNLLKNAIKFTPHGGCIAIRCQLNNQNLMIDVVDSGEGIAPDILPLIFNPFEQGGIHVTQHYGGLGLGLTITKGLVEMHGGTINAYSQGKGKGATFRISLPIYVPPEMDLPHSTPQDLPTDVSPIFPSTTPHQLRILLVEDHTDTARMMRQLLMVDGHKVEIACDVATALQLAATQTFDLLLCDLGLPDGNGVDLIQQLHQRGDAFPGIALSGYGQEDDLRRTREAGFAAHLTKPINPDRLAETIALVSSR